MTTQDELKIIFERIVAGNETSEDIKTLQQAFESRERISFQYGEHVVNIGQGQDIQFGPRIIQNGFDVETIKLALQELLHFVSKEPDDLIKQRKLKLESPYKGLDKFETEDKDKFFGRERLIDDLSKYLDKKFINLTFVPDEDPYESLYACLISKYGQAKAKIAHQGEPNTLIQVVETLKQDSKWLIFIDQFEELFTISQKGKRENFIDGITQLGQYIMSLQDHPVKIVLAMRSDFLDEFSPYPDLGDIHDHYSRMLTDMNRSELRLAIAKPAAKNGVVFQEGLVEQIIDDLQGQPGYLPLLQYTLNLLWDSDDLTGRTLNTQTYHNLGGVMGALQQRADRIYDELLPEEKEAAKQIFIDLVDVRGEKLVGRRSDKAKFIDAGVLENTLNKLARTQNRLLVIGQQEKERPTVAVAHEALLTSWSKLQVWIQETKEIIIFKNRLIDDAKYWINLRTKDPQKANDELWSGSKLERVLDLRETNAFSTLSLSAEANQFIEASVAWRDRQEADKTLKEVQEHTRASLFLFDSDQKLDALIESLYAGIALQKLGTAKAEHLETVLALRRAIYCEKEFNRWKAYDEVAVTALNFSPDGQTIATGSRDSSVKLWRRDGVLLNTLQGYSHKDAVYAIAFSPDGQTIVTGSWDKTVNLWRRDGILLTTLKGHEGPVYGVAFSPDSQTIASGSADRTVKLWRRDGTLLKTLEGHEGTVYGVAFSPDGKMIASTSEDETVKLWRRNGTLLKTLEGHDYGVESVAFSPDSQTIVTGSWDKTVKLWRRDGTLLTIVHGHGDEIYGVAFSPDGQTIASASSDRTVKLWRRDGTLLTTLQGHKAAVNRVVFSPDGQTIASASSDRTVKLWTRDGILLNTLKSCFIYPEDYPENYFDYYKGHCADVYGIAFSPDGQTIVTGSWDKTVKLWSLDGVVLTTFGGHFDDVEAVNFSPDGQTIVSGSRDWTVKLWRQDGTLLNTFQGHDGAIEAVSFSPDGQIIASASSDKTAKLWSLDGTLLKNLQGHEAEVIGIAFSPDSQTIVTGSRDKTVKLWRRDGTLLNTLEGHNDAIYKVAISPDNKIASTSYDQTIKLWSFDGSLLKTLVGHTEAVYGIAFSPNGQMIVSTSRDGTVKLWSIDGTLLKTFEGYGRYEEISELERYPNSVEAVAFSPDGQIIASGKNNGEVKLWKCHGNPLETLEGHKDEVYGVAFSPDGQTIASAARDKTVILWKRDGTLQKTLRGHSAPVIGVAFSPDGQTIASASRDKTIILWNPDGTRLRTLKGHGDGVEAVVFSTDGQTIASASRDKTIILWNPDGTRLRTLKGHGGGVEAVVFDPDSQIIASGGKDKTIKLWNRDGTLQTTLKGHNGSVIGVAFSPDGQTIASASRDKTIKLWNRDGTLQTTLKGHNSSVIGVAFSPDGQTIASASRDKTIKLWNRDGNLLDTLEGHSNGVYGLAFSPDSRTIVSASLDRKLILWNLDLENLLIRGCNWVRDYLRASSDVSESYRHLCDGIGT